jgi:hypothetical protein
MLKASTLLAAVFDFKEAQQGISKRLVQAER